MERSHELEDDEMDRAKHHHRPDDQVPGPDAERVRDLDRDASVNQEEAANPPHTTTGKVTSPKFGSAGSGGLEYEGNLPRD